MMKLRFEMLLTLAFGMVASAEVINVPGDFSTIQAAIDAATDGDEIVVSASNFEGKTVTVRAAQRRTAQGGELGACCFSCCPSECGKNPCCTDTSLDDCNDQGGNWRGAGTQCNNTSCVGACCSPDGSCTLIPQHGVQECEEKGIWRGIDTTCDDPCPGSCCLPTGQCTGVLIEADCLDLDGEFQGGGTPDCLPDSICKTFGACCIPSSGNCIMTTEPDCAHESNQGIWMGPDENCDDANFNNIPDVCETCPADINDDGVIGPVDLAMLLGAWGVCE